MTKKPKPELPSAEELVGALGRLSPEDLARAAWEVRVDLLAREAIATSAIEGISLDPKEVRRAILLRLAKQEGLL
jgi:hypothetical protein